MTKFYKGKLMIGDIFFDLTKASVVKIKNFCTEVSISQTVFYSLFQPKLM